MRMSVYFHSVHLIAFVEEVFYVEYSLALIHLHFIYSFLCIFCRDSKTESRSKQWMLTFTSRVRDPHGQGDLWVISDDWEPRMCNDYHRGIRTSRRQVSNFF
jgi:hypothetical protein